MRQTRHVAIVLSAVLSVGLSGDTGIDQVDAITAALRARDFEQAVEHSRSALRKAPNDPQLWTLQGIAFASMGKRSEALQSFQRALKIDPNYMAALEGAAQLHYEAGSRRAVPLLNRILQRRPGEPTAHAMLAVLSPGTATARRRLDTSSRRVR